MINFELLRRAAEPFGVQIDSLAAERFDCYAALVCEWNQKFNLTAITDPDGIAVRHFADSLSLLAATEVPNGARLIDVGSGAGFPGLPLAIVRGDLQVTLIDSTNKRVGFLREVVERLGLTATAIHTRAEDAAALPELREQFDIATARAVAPMHLLAEYCLGFVRVGGCFVALKGPGLPEELAEGKRAIATMGGGDSSVHSFTLLDGSSRLLAVIQKRSQTPTEYPRKSAKISKFPLL